MKCLTCGASRGSNLLCWNCGRPLPKLSDEQLAREYLKENPSYRPPSKKLKPVKPGPRKRRGGRRGAAGSSPSKTGGKKK